jgi:shikimate dehydrogenase
MKIYGLIGNPLSHSFSQKYFTEKFRVENITDCIYSNFELKNLLEKLPQLKNEKNLCGLNVTIPYKSQIIPFLDTISNECKEINACNCIKIIDAKWTGFNTDIIGFEKTFIPHLQPHHTKALIIGTGGSAKAVAYVLKKLKINFLFVSRAKEISDDVIHYDSITPLMMEEYTTVINTTPAGMFPNVNEYPKLPYDYVSTNHYFFDLIYNPSKTLFLSKAEAKGAVIENGQEMLSIQADESWKIWSK